jgi:hypothetical protein
MDGAFEYSLGRGGAGGGRGLYREGGRSGVEEREGEREESIQWR